MDNVLGQEYANPAQRRNFLRDNCDSVENLGYTKSIPLEKIEDLKDKLVENNIQLRDVRADKRAQDKLFNDQIKQLEGSNEEYTKQLKEKSEFVNEDCFKFIEEKTVGYYNEDGILVYSRPARPEEMQGTIQMELRRTGTHD